MATAPDARARQEAEQIADMASEPDGNDDRDEDEDFGGLVFSVMTVAEAEALVLSSFRMTWRVEC